MAIEPIQSDLIKIALDRVEGFNFERFVNDFYPALVGRSFVPLGGVKDGGADAFESAVFEDAKNATSFYQASVGVEVESKIRSTVMRLKEFGRDPKTLTYVTSRSVKYVDTVEADLVEELDVTIRIRDAAYLSSHINDGPRTQTAFNDHLRHLTDYLKSVGNSEIIHSSIHVRQPAVYVFLSQELRRKSGDESLVSAMIDSLALWALEDTDPALERFMNLDEVQAKIDSALPSARAIVAPRLKRRLEVLASKAQAEGRRVKHYRAEDKYCLPYETRVGIAEENAHDVALRIDVLESLDDRIRSTPLEGLGDVGIRTAAQVALRSLQITFEKEGLEFASFLSRQDSEEHSPVVDCIALALDEVGESGRHRLLVAEAAFQAIRGVLYDSRAREREYLERLSRTYALLFTLNTEPRLIQFFQDMAADFYLYVGADQLVRALSEHLLAPADQMTRNTLLMASRAGAHMVLTETVLDEVVWNLRTSDFEYKNVIRPVEKHVTYAYARNSPKILVRSYLYATMNSDLGRRRPSNWEAYVQQFLDYKDLHKVEAFEAIRGYLQRTFNMAYKSRADLAALVDATAMETLAARLAVKKNEQLARNDALTALAVYGNRRRMGERAAVSEFGYRTWWLTSETAILRHTQDLVSQNGNVRYILRPDFLLNFLTLAPAASQAREAFANVFPSLLGMTLARRMPEQAFKSILAKVAEAENLDDARRGVAIGRCADQLKGEFDKQYLTNLDGRGALSTVDAAALRDEMGS